VQLWRLSATQLSTLLARGEVRAREIVDAHIRRIEAVDGRVRAFTEVFREQAAADADAADRRRKDRAPRSPLDGVPVSVKECFDIAGRPTTLGLPAWRDRFADRDATLITLLRRAGAIVLGRTNLSQTMLYVEASNPLFGRTTNPWNSSRSPGGSSGGEAAAVASGMSPLGVGTDIGGSLRVPAHFCGVSAFKPTLDRLPMRGYRTVLAGQETVRAMAGPIARSTSDLALFFRAIDPSLASQLDPRVPPLAWEARGAPRIQGARCGVWDYDGLIRPSRAIDRAVRRATEALKAQGCHVDGFEPPRVAAALAAQLGALSADGGAAVLAALGDGEIDPALEPLRRLARIPSRARRLLVGATRAFGQAGLSLMLGAIGEKTVGELWRLTDRLRSYRAELLEAMDARGIDLLLCPPHATCALPHGASRNFALASSYSMLFNATQMPAGVVPVTRVRLEESSRSPGRDALERRAALVDDGSVGLPVGIQVVGKPWQDEVVLSAMETIEASVRDDAGFPATPVDPTR
jgi:fatty acid amide hydrolase